LPRLDDFVGLIWNWTPWIHIGIFPIRSIRTLVCE
jgi:hypothetical protein